MAQTPKYPRRLFSFCEVTPSSGGATAVCRSDELFRRIQEEEPEFARNCETNGLLYTHVMPEDDNPQSGMGRSWRNTLSVDSKEAAEARLQKLNYTWKWDEDGGIRVTTPVLPAVREIPPGRKTYFNQLIAFTQDETLLSLRNIPECSTATDQLSMIAPHLMLWKSQNP